MKSRTCVSVYPKDADCFVIKISKKEYSVWVVKKILDIDENCDVKVYKKDEKERDAI